MSTVLSSSAHARLEELETVIERGLATFVDVGLALMEVRDSHLYRQTHGTFEDYCTDRWQMARRTAYQFIEAAGTVENVRNCAQVEPATESQARPLARLSDPDPEDKRRNIPNVEAQRAVWAEVVETAPRNDEGEPVITAAHVETVVREFEGRPQMAVHYRSDTPEWYTPQHIVEAVIAALGAIDLDPCSNPGAPNIPASQHFTYADDGLVKYWDGRVYMNPPYGDLIGAWTEKLLRDFRAGRVTEAVALIPARTDTRWFSPFYDCAICFIAGRLKFGGPGDMGAPFPSAAVYLGPDPERFAAAFSALGAVMVRYA